MARKQAQVITLIIMTDGRRDCFQEMEQSLYRLKGPVTQKIIHDDSADPSYALWLDNEYGDKYEIYHTPTRSGFGGAIRSAWSLDIQNPWIWHMEDDFVLTKDIDLVAMQSVMNNDLDIVQMALRRQPWNEIEAAAGGIVESCPQDYIDMSDGINEWLEHRKFFTTNPSLYRQQITVDYEWPDCEHSEGHFGIKVFLNKYHRSAFWGSRASGEWCRHIGNERVGYGY